MGVKGQANAERGSEERETTIKQIQLNNIWRIWLGFFFLIVNDFLLSLRLFQN